MSLPPLFIVSGAFGAGKSTLAPLVARSLPECFVLDVDWLLGPLSELAGHDLSEDEFEAQWPALRRVWLALVAVNSRAGRPSVLFCPAAFPEEFEGLRERSFGEIFWLLLDCEDTILDARLRQRPEWTPALTRESLVDAKKLRQIGLPTIHTDAVPPTETANLISEWIRERLRNAHA